MNMNKIAVGVIIGGGSFLGWMGLFKLSRRLLTRYFLQQKREMSHHHVMNMSEAIVSITQSFISSVCGIIVVASCRHDVMRAANSLSSWYAWCIGSYFVYDTIAMYKAHLSSLSSVPDSFVARIRSFMKRRPLLIAHHVVIATVLCPILVYRDGIGDFFVGCFYCVELSGPFTNMRIILSRIGLKNSRWYFWNGMAMIASFALCRVLIFPYMYLTYGNAYDLSIFGVMKKIPWHCNLGSLMVLLPQIHWLRLMILGAIKISKGKTLSDADEKID